MSDQVESPKHYIENREHEPWDVCFDWDLDFDLGNVVKYCARFKRKDNALEDLEKAQKYLNHRIEKFKKYGR